MLRHFLSVLKIIAEPFQLTSRRQHARRDSILYQPDYVICESSNGNGLVPQTTRWCFGDDRVARRTHANGIDQSADD